VCKTINHPSIVCHSLKISIYPHFKNWYIIISDIEYNLWLFLLLLFYWRLQPICGFLASSVLRFWDYTQGRTTVHRTPLDEWSVRRRDLYLTNTQHSQQTNIHGLGGILTRNPSRRVAADPCLRPLVHWYRHLWWLGHIIMTKNVCLSRCKDHKAM
jgi:hypothetical protein